MEKLKTKCKVECTESSGSRVIALQKIDAGEDILSEFPILITPHWDSNVRCSTCFRDSNVMCKDCNFFPLCVTCESHDSFDCDFFQKITSVSKNFLIDNYATFGPLKCLLTLENPKETAKAKDLMELPSFLEKRRNSDIWLQHQDNVVDPLTSSGLLKEFKNVEIDSDLLQKICGVLDVNCFEIRNLIGETIKGVYPSAAKLSHNCTPNTMMAVGNDYKLKILATIPIEEGVLVESSYTNPLMGTSVRQHLLKTGKYFTCDCARCKDPTEFGTYLSSLKCKSCSEGNVIHVDSQWICEQCSAIMPNEQVNSILIETNNDILDADGDIRQMESLIKKFSYTFHPNHYLIIDLKQSVASILRSICTSSMVRPGKPVFERKIQLCEEILPILKVLQPGISRLNAIAMYEYFLPLVEVATIDYEAKDIAEENYLKILQEAEKLAKESARMLLYEPINSPEGQLAQQVLSEVKNLRDNINKIK